MPSILSLHLFICCGSFQKETFNNLYCLRAVVYLQGPTITCSFEENYLCGYSRLTTPDQQSTWQPVAGAAGNNEGPTVDTTYGNTTGILSPRSLAKRSCHSIWQFFLVLFLFSS